VATVLVIEDETDIADVLAFNLEREGHEVHRAETGKSGLAIAKQRSVDLILLDLMLPDMRGAEVCRELRAHFRTVRPLILMLTALGDEIDRVVGFESGADDYVTKPFSVRELMLRVRALLRRAEPAQRPSSDPQARRESIGVLAIDRDAHRVWVDGTETNLTALEFKLLTTLWDRAGRVQSREALLTDVWEMSADLTTRTVDTHVTRLRRKLGEAGSYIETLRGVGYRFRDPND
jgi:two-component system phosphate regulon response regulator PhoB